MHQSYPSIPLSLSLCVLILLPWVAWSQPPTTRELPPAATYRLPVAEQRQQELEQDLSQRIKEFRTLPSAARDQAKIEIETLLFNLFDLNISQQESQAKSLRHQLQKMEADPEYNGQNAEIQRLQSALRQVESGLEYRRKNRQQIVEQRMRELLGG